MNESELDLESEDYDDFIFNEEADAIIDGLLDSIGATREDYFKFCEQPKIAMLNGMMKYDLAYKIIKKVVKGINLSISQRQDKLMRGMGAINIVGKNIIISNHDLFMKSVKLASNLEVYPKTDGTVQMNLTFHGLTTAIPYDEKGE